MLWHTAPYSVLQNLLDFCRVCRPSELGGDFRGWDHQLVANFE